LEISSDLVAVTGLATLMAAHLPDSVRDLTGATDAAAGRAHRSVRRLTLPGWLDGGWRWLGLGGRLRGTPTKLPTCRVGTAASG